MKIHLFDKIIAPHVTEKATNLSEQNKIIFKVHKKANKINLKKNIINKKPKIKVTRGKKVKVTGFKKAIVTLKKGQNIDLTTGI